MVFPVPSHAVLQYLLSSDAGHPQGGFLHVSGSSAIVPPESVVYWGAQRTDYHNQPLLLISIRSKGHSLNRPFRTQKPNGRALLVLNSQHQGVFPL